MKTFKFDIGKFNRSVNFGLWKRKMRVILVQQGWEKALAGKSNKPISMTDDQFKEIDLKALSAIQLCLSDEVLQVVTKEETTVGLWLKLESMYMKKSVTNRLLLKSKLHDLKLQEGKPIKTHIDEFCSIVMDLHNIDIELDDEDLAIYLLCSLPPSYKHVRETLLYGRDEVNFEDIKDALLQHELTQEQLVKKDSNPGVSARLVAKGSYAIGESSNLSHKDLVCNYCHKKRHIKRNCSKLKNKKR